MARCCWGTVPAYRPIVPPEDDDRHWSRCRLWTKVTSYRYRAEETRMPALEKAVAGPVPVPMAERWIVCLGELRGVSASPDGGAVDCPFNGAVPFDRCLDCRLLEDSVAGWRRQPCGTSA